MQSYFLDFESTEFGPLKSFFAGKYLQQRSSRLATKEEKGEEDEMREKKVSQYFAKKEFSSSLSLKIQKLLVEFPKRMSVKRNESKNGKKLEGILIEPEMVIDWNKLSEEALKEWEFENLVEEIGSNQVNENPEDEINIKMRKKGFFLCDVSLAVHEQLHKVEKQVFVEKLFSEKVRKIFDPATKKPWKDQKQKNTEIEKKFEGDSLWGFVFDCYHSEESSEQIVCFQLCVSLLERGLGTIFNSVTNEKVPHTTRELIEKEIFTKIFGEHRRQLIQSFIGHPEGLNLRNVLWHGFLTTREFSGKPFLSLLFSFFLSIAKLVENFTFEDKVVVFKERFMRNNSFFDDSLSDFGLGKLVFKENCLDIENIKKLVDGNFFLVNGYEDLFLKSVFYFNQGNYYASLCLILPILEHCLRIIFCSVNKLEERFYFY